VDSAVRVTSNGTGGTVDFLLTPTLTTAGWAAARACDFNGVNTLDEH
jgi:hypothetical protein